MGALLRYDRNIPNPRSGVGGRDPFARTDVCPDPSRIRQVPGIDEEFAAQIVACMQALIIGCGPFHICVPDELVQGAPAVLDEEFAGDPSVLGCDLARFGFRGFRVTVETDVIRRSGSGRAGVIVAESLSYHDLGILGPHDRVAHHLAECPLVEVPQLVVGHQPLCRCRGERIRILFVFVDVLIVRYRPSALRYQKTLADDVVRIRNV